MSNSFCSIPAGTKVLVTGATGFTGSVLIKKLCAAGLNVHAIARPSSSLAQFESDKITWHLGQVYDKDLIEHATKNASYIFHVAAAFREAKIEDGEYRRVHVESTQALAKAAKANPNFKRFIHVSTMGVHGHIENPPGDENSPYAPGDLYQITKLEAENWLKDFATINDLAYTIIRPTAIYGPGDKRLLKVFKMASWPIFPILGFGKCLYHLIHVEDLTNVIMLSATHPGALSEAFIVGAPSAIKLEDFAKITAKVIGNKLRVVRVPVTPFFVLGDICEFICKPFGIEPPIYRRRVAFYTKDRSFKTSKLRSVLGYNVLYDNEKGITETAKWYLENGWIKSKNTRTEPDSAAVSDEKKNIVNG
jgi:nucleoside-diphosphate-sugar epimerase